MKRHVLFVPVIGLLRRRSRESACRTRSLAVDYVVTDHGDVVGVTPRGRRLSPAEYDRLKSLQQNDTDLCRAFSVESLAGVDEAGRGAWAGPVFAGAMSFNESGLLLYGVNDSKRVTEVLRGEIFETLSSLRDSEQSVEGRSLRVDCAHEMSPSTFIDEHGIEIAVRNAMVNAVRKLRETPRLVAVDKVSFKLEAQLRTSRVANIRGGDQLDLAIAAASILAKVARDRWMREAHERWPQYGFAQHKGYGTQQHREALEKYGPCPIHRMSYKPVQRVAWKD